MASSGLIEQLLTCSKMPAFSMRHSDRGSWVEQDTKSIAAKEDNKRVGYLIEGVRKGFRK